MLLMLPFSWWSCELLRVQDLFAFWSIDKSTLHTSTSAPDPPLQHFSWVVLQISLLFSSGAESAQVFYHGSANALLQQDQKEVQEGLAQTCLMLLCWSDHPVFWHGCLAFAGRGVWQLTLLDFFLVGSILRPPTRYLHRLLLKQLAVVACHVFHPCADGLVKGKTAFCLIECLSLMIGALRWSARCGVFA